jgi:hypothetical protein
VADTGIYRDVDTGPYHDGQLELRLKNRLDAGSRLRLQTHYELVGVGGDTLENTNALVGRLRSLQDAVWLPSTRIDDDRRLMDLTHILSETDRALVYHRLDRLNLTYTPEWGTLCLGRQALTWGDGLVFNPLDLFNPFAPTTVQRDYKPGDDMLHLQLPLGDADMQLVVLPRRNPQTNEVESAQSSYAANFHLSAGSVETSIVGANNYDDDIVGWGSSGYVGEAAWRVDAIFTHLDDYSQEDDFFQIVANLDYAWVWGGKNIYGLVECYYNGLGLTGDYDQVVNNASLLSQLERGEMFTLGRYYLAVQMQVELHPLVQLHTTAIANLSDPSGVVQPQVMWDVAGDLQAIIGVQWNWGDDGSEYGGFQAGPTDDSFTVAPADRLYVWLTYYF